MADSAEINLVVEYALDSRQRLATALAVYDSYDEIRRPIIKKFVSELKYDVLGKLDLTGQKWIVEAWPNVEWALKRDCQLKVRQEDWPDGCYVGIGAGKYGPADMWFGVSGVSDERLAKGIFPYLGQRIAAGGWVAPNANPPRQWCIGFGHVFEGRWELSDWRRTDAVLAMYEGKAGDYHQRTRDTIIEIAHATHEFLHCQNGIGDTAKVE